MAFGKISPSMYTGSMVGAGAMAFALMPYCIANARVDEDCGLDLNPVVLSAIFGEPVKKVNDAITYLCSPDEYSRTPDSDGRRLIHIGPGPFRYKVVNLQKYREDGASEDRNEYWRQYRQWERSGRKGKFTMRSREQSELFNSVQSTECRVQMQSTDTGTDKSANGNATLRNVTQHPEAEAEPVEIQEKLPIEAERWNVVCGAISKVVTCGKGRMKHLYARRKEPFWRLNFESGLEKIRTSVFCQGINDKGWKATFDWLIEQPDALAKIIEGKYDNRKGTSSRGTSGKRGFDRNKGTLNEGLAERYDLKTVQANRAVRNVPGPAVGADAGGNSPVCGEHQLCPPALLADAQRPNGSGKDAPGPGSVPAVHGTEPV